MPLDNSPSCDALFANVATLKKEFIAKGHSEEKARSMAVSGASRICRENGGDPSACTSKEG